MKAFILTCLACCCLWPSEGRAQVLLQDTAADWQAGHVKLSVTGPVAGALYTIFSWPGFMVNAGAGYEFTLSPRRSICLTANGTFFRQSFWWWGFEMDEDIFMTHESMTFSGQYRFYFKDAWVEGFYAGPSIAANKLYRQDPNFIWNPAGGTTLGWFTTRSIAFGGGGTIGYQHVSDNGLSMDVFIGLHAGPQWSTWTSDEGEEEQSSFVGVIPTGSFTIGKLLFYRAR